VLDWFNNILAHIENFKIAPKYGTKIILSVGEFFHFPGAAMQTDNFALVAATEQSRTDFVDQITTFVLKYNLNGIVIHWLAPDCVMVICGLAN
jgi:GH18 family chitinase